MIDHHIGRAKDKGRGGGRSHGTSQVSRTLASTPHPHVSDPPIIASHLHTSSSSTRSLHPHTSNLPSPVPHSHASNPPIIAPPLHTSNPHIIAPHPHTSNLSMPSPYGQTFVGLPHLLHLHISMHHPLIYLRCHP